MISECSKKVGSSKLGDAGKMRVASKNRAVLRKAQRSQF